MDSISSAEFRKTYAKLTEVTEVTVNGHLIGRWVPVTSGLAIGLNPADGTVSVEPPPMKGQPVTIEVETAYPYEPGSLKVGLLGHDASGFNSRPFTPVPKKGK